MKALKKRLVVLLLIAGALFISNPKLSTHKEKIAEKFKEENPLAGKIGGADLIKEIVAYDNYYLFSLGRISVTNDPVSFGVAGFVVVFASLDINKYRDILKKHF